VKWEGGKLTPSNAKEEGDINERLSRDYDLRLISNEISKSGIVTNRYQGCNGAKTKKNAVSQIGQVQLQEEITS
jgi:hypothetical protein